MKFLPLRPSKETMEVLSGFLMLDTSMKELPRERVTERTHSRMTGSEPPIQRVENVSQDTRVELATTRELLQKIKELKGNV